MKKICRGNRYSGGAKAGIKYIILFGQVVISSFNGLPIQFSGVGLCGRLIND